MSNRCVYAPMVMEDVRKLNQEQLAELGVPKDASDNIKNNALELFARVLADHLSKTENEDERKALQEPDNITSLIKEKLTKTIEKEKEDSIKDLQEKTKGTLTSRGLSTVGHIAFSEDKESQERALGIIGMFLDEDAFTVFVDHYEADSTGQRKIKSVSYAFNTIKAEEKTAQEKTLDRLKELKAYGESVERVRNTGSKKVDGLGTFWQYRLPNGNVIWAVGATKYKEKEGDAYPILSGPLGTAVDAVGRMFFDKKSELWKGGWSAGKDNTALLRQIIDGDKDLVGFFTPQGLQLLLEDFQVLEGQIKDKWGKDCVFFADKMKIYGKLEGSQNLWTAGEPDLLVVDGKGQVHVMDFKSVKMTMAADKPINSIYDSVFERNGEGHDIYNRDISYGRQLTIYVRTLQSYGVSTDNNPWLIVIDSYYDSDNGKNKKETVVRRHPSGRGWEVKDTKGNWVPMVDTTGLEEEGNERMQERVYKNSTLRYVQPRLHVARKGEGKFSNNVMAMKDANDNVIVLDDTISFKEQFDVAPQKEKDAMQWESGPIVETRKPAQGIKTYSKSNLLGNPGLMSAEEVQEAANLFMYEVYLLIENISKGLNLDYINTYKGKLTGKSHDEIVKRVGINKLINYVWNENKPTKDTFPTWEDVLKEQNTPDLKKRPLKKYYNNKEKWEINKERFEKKKWFYDPEHKNQAMKFGAAKLMALEKVVKINASEDKNTESQDDVFAAKEDGDNGTTEEAVEVLRDGASTMEAWIMGEKQVSPRSTLAQEVRRMYEGLEQKFKKTIDGKEEWVTEVHPVFGFSIPIDSKAAIEATREALKYCETYDEMVTELEKLAQVDECHWAADILEQLRKNENLQKKFYSNFRKDAFTYSYSYLKFNKKTKKQELVTRIINKKSAYDTMMQSLGASFTKGVVGEFEIVKGSTVHLIEDHKLVRGSNNITTAAFIKKEISEIKSLINSFYADYYQVRREERAKMGLSILDYIYMRIDDYRDEDNRGNVRTLYERIGNVLHGVGILIPTDIIQAVCRASSGKNEQNNLPTQLLNNAKEIIEYLETQDKKSEGIPHGLSGNSSFRYYKEILGWMADKVKETVEASCYQGGKTYYSYSYPSKLQHIVRNIKDAAHTYDVEKGKDPEIIGPNSETKFGKYMYREFGRYGWFKQGRTWMCDWIDQLVKNPAARKALDHKVELSFLGNEYEDLGSLGFLMSILTNYYGTKDDEDIALNDRVEYRWFAMPTMSNKPTNEFIRMIAYQSHDEIIDRVLMKTFRQECLRMADVLYHFITNIQGNDKMDLTEEKLLGAGFTDEEIKGLKERINNQEVTLEDLQKLSKTESGAKFHFLWYLNKDLKNKTTLAEGIRKRINDLLKPGNDKKSVSADATFNAQVREALQKNMEEVVQSELNEMENVGIFSTDEQGRFIYQERMGDKLGEPKSLVGLGEQARKEAIAYNRKLMEDALKEFIWQDIAATINIIQITGGDLAFYGNAVNYQKRIAQIHSPGTHMMNDPKYSDGYLRSIHIKDDYIMTELYNQTEIALQKYLDDNMRDYSPEAKQDFKNMMNIILSRLKKEVITTDGQSFNSPTSIRKKLALQDKWDDKLEEAYRKIKKGNFNIQDLGVLLQAQKPFVTADVAKYSGSPAITLRKNPIQDKNSEFLIVLAEAIISGAGLRSKMTAICNFMEETARINPKQGIDTTHFESVGKVGLTGVISMKAIDEEFDELLRKEKRTEREDEYNEFVTNRLLELTGRKKAKEGTPFEKMSPAEQITYKEESFLSPEERVYDNQYVDTIQLEEYIIQQEAPVHEFDDDRLFGSQIRILGLSDTNPDADFYVNDNEKVKGKDLVDECKNLQAENIRESFFELMDRMGFGPVIDSKTAGLSAEKFKALSQEEKNVLYKKLRFILQRELAQDMRYGPDAMEACELEYDESGNVIDFVVPLHDSMQSNRIQMLLNSIIKKAINKQEIRGISLIQTTAYDNRLHINFKGIKKDGDKVEIVPLKTYAEFAKDKRGQEKDIQREYQKYLKDMHASIANYECYMPVPDPALEALITKEDGTLMSVEDVQKKMPEVWKKLSECIGYRIPTEDKYSMMPLKIVGFLPRACGQSIMLPQEIVWLTGADFDFDKVYVMLRDFKTTTIDEKSSVDKWMQERGFADALTDVQYATAKEIITRVVKNANRIMRGDKGVYLWSGLPDASRYAIFSNKGKTFRAQTFIEYVRDMLMKGYTLIDDVKSNNYKEARSARNNRILDLHWAVLTSEDTMVKMLNPGNFNEITMLGYIAEIISDGIKHEDGKPWTETELKELFYKEGEDALQNLLEGNNPHNTTLPTSKLYFQRQNMQGTQMVGIFANNNVSHAFLSFQKIAINLNKNQKNPKSFFFNGIEIGNPSNLMVVDPIQGFNGQLVSKTIASCLAASVDTAKKPVLDKLNINTFTGNVAMVLIRLGFDMRSVGYFLRQPIIRKVSDLYFRKSTDGYYDGTTAIKEVAREIGIEYGGLNKQENIKSLSMDTLTVDNFLKGLDSNNADMHAEKSEFQKRVLVAFNILFQMTNDFKEITFCTKFNSVTNAGGPTIMDSMEEADRVREFIDTIKDSCFHVPSSIDKAKGFTDPSNVIQNDPILNAFYQYTLGSGGASEVLFGCFFPHYLQGTKNMLKGFLDSYTKKKKLGADLRNQLLNDFIYFLMTFSYKDEESGTVIDPTFPSAKEGEDTEKELNYLVKGIIERFRRIVNKEGRKPNMILDQGINKNCLRLREKDEYFKEDLLVFDSGKIDAEEQQKIKNAWTDLMQSSDPEIRRFGNDLFFYMLMRNGFGFNPKTMMHLASVMTKRNAKYERENYSSYLDGMRNVEQLISLVVSAKSSSFLMDRFYDQFIRNHYRNKDVVPNIKGDSDTTLSVNPKDPSIITFSVPKNEDYKLYRILKGNSPVRYITVTGLLDGKLHQDLYRVYDARNPNSSDNVEVSDLGDTLTVSYKKVEQLGLPNHFIEYNANDDLKDYSFFKSMRGNMDEEEMGEEEYYERDDQLGYASDDVDPAQEKWNAVSRAITEVEGKDRNDPTVLKFRKELSAAYRKNPNVYEEVFDEFLEKKDKVTLDKIKKIFEDNNKC